MSNPSLTSYYNSNELLVNALVRGVLSRAIEAVNSGLSEGGTFEWNAATVFAFRIKGSSNFVVTFRNGRFDLQLSAEVPSGAVEILVSPDALLKILKEKTSVRDAVARGELEILRASLVDVVRLQALLELATRHGSA